MVDYAKRMAGVKPSDVREILKLTARPEITSFAGGLPAPELFPVEDLRVASDLVLKESGPVALQYATTEGNPKLRTQIAQRLGEKNNIQTTMDHIFITAGSQQGLDYCGKLFLDPGDVVLVESPSYLGAINAFQAYEPRFVEVPTDGDGMIMEELDRILATTERVKLIYVIPDFQNPSGRTWPLERRRQFMQIINKYGVYAIEDNPYGELRYAGEFLPALKSMDSQDQIIYMGTFSKILAPGYRLGWLCCSAELMWQFNMIASAAVLQTATVSMMVVSKYLELFDVDAHVETIRACYKHRCGVMLEAMDRYFPEEVTYTRPQGGLFTWAELPHYIDTKEMALQALEQKVAYVPGIGFFPNGGNHSCMRLNYSCMPDERIVDGIHRLGDVIKANLK